MQQKVNHIIRRGRVAGIESLMAWRIAVPSGLPDLGKPNRSALRHSRFLNIGFVLSY